MDAFSSWPVDNESEISINIGLGNDIAWPNVDSSSVRSSDIHLRATSQEMPQLSINHCLLIHSSVTDDKVAIMTTLGYQWEYPIPHPHHRHTHTNTHTHRLDYFIIVVADVLVPNTLSISNNHAHTSAIEKYRITQYTYCMPLTHWSRVTNICVRDLTIIGSNNGLSPSRRQTIIWTNVNWTPPRTYFIEILIEIHTFSFKKIRLKMSSGKWRQSCLRLNVLNKQLSTEVGR